MLHLLAQAAYSAVGKLREWHKAGCLLCCVVSFACCRLPFLLQNTNNKCPQPSYSTVCYTPKGMAYYSDW